MSKTTATKSAAKVQPKTDDKEQKTTEPSLPIAPNSHVHVTLPWSTVAPAYQKAIRRYAQNAKADGFRKGKVPLEMVEKMVEPSALVEYVLQQVLPTAYADAVKAADKHPISQPEIEPEEIEKGKDWKLTASFAEAPSIKLGEYKAIVKKAKKAAEKDIADAEAELVKKAKDAKPEDDKAEKAPTTLTDAQKEDLQTRQIFRHLVEELNPQIGELLVRREADRQIRQLLDQLDQLKLSVENYLKSRNMSAEQLRLEYLSSSATSLQLEFILAEIGKEEKLSVDDKEIDEMMKQVFGENMTDEQAKNPDYRSYVFNTLVKQKIVKHLLSL
jgi:FKBP-type peptidyl-prolyl cis-trans isomerase (trigger factor)